MEIVNLNPWDVQFDPSGNPVYRKFTISGAYIEIPLRLDANPAVTANFKYAVVDGEYVGYYGYSEF